jgi:hypothetical protein
METDDVVKATINERCRFWPACANGNECQYIHPTIPCKYVNSLISYMCIKNGMVVLSDYQMSRHLSCDINEIKR